MIKGVISSDIVAHTSLSQQSRDDLGVAIQTLFGELENRFSIFARTIKGDYLEMVTHPADLLRIAILTKTYIRSLDDMVFVDKKRGGLFKKFGIRMALGYGNLDRFDPKKGIIDGDIIHRTGRRISGEQTHDLKRVSIQQSMFFECENADFSHKMDVILSFTDFLLVNASAKQSKVLFHKLLDKNETKIAEEIGITQSVVNRHASIAGWYSIKKAVEFYEQELNNYPE